MKPQRGESLIGITEIRGWASVWQAWSLSVYTDIGKYGQPTIKMHLLINMYFDNIYSDPYSDNCGDWSKLDSVTLKRHFLLSNLC